MVNHEFEGLSINDMADPSCANWVHHVQYVLPQVSCALVTLNVWLVNYWGEFQCDSNLTVVLISNNSDYFEIGYNYPKSL